MHVHISTTLDLLAYPCVEPVSRQSGVSMGSRGFPGHGVAGSGRGPAALAPSVGGGGARAVGSCRSWVLI